VFTYTYIRLGSKKTTDRRVGGAAQSRPTRTAARDTRPLFLLASTGVCYSKHQNKVLRTIGNFLRRIPVRELHMAFQVQYIYDYVSKLCRQQAEVIENYENANVRNIG
jgi:hypothetical protein